MYRVLHLNLKISIIICLISFPTNSQCWLLTSVGLNESYRVQHLSMHFSRVFMSLQVKSKQFPTLLETQWPQPYLPELIRIYPTIDAHFEQRDDCRRIQQSWWSQVDALSRLWVLDLGWQNADGSRQCSPKILVFDLLRADAEVREN